MNDGITLNVLEKRNAVLSDFSEQIRDLTTDQLKNIGTYFREKEIGRRKAMISLLVYVYYGFMET